MILALILVKQGWLVSLKTDNIVLRNEYNFFVQHIFLLYWNGSQASIKFLF